MLVIKVKKLHPDVKLPTKATEGSACWDVYSLEDIWLSLSPKLVSTGLSIEVPLGYLLEVRPRSGLSLEGVYVANSPGTIDSDYRGEFKVIMWYCRDTQFVGGYSYLIKKWDRVAQIRIEKVWPAQLKEVEELSETERGTGGFGSTGK